MALLPLLGNNNFAANPFYVDTAQDVSELSPVYVDQIIWSGQGAGDTLVIHDHGGRIVCNETAPGTDDIKIDLGSETPVWGLNFVTVGGGHVRVFIR
jgi:hypothetical protein